jgi:hypothetical protein
VPLTASTGWTASTNQLLTFPAFSFDESIEYSLNDIEAFKLFINETVEQSTVLGTMISISPVYLRNLGTRWKIGVYPNLIYNLSLGVIFNGMVKASFDLY